MKLELKHLLGYLPYKLKIYNTKIEVLEMDCCGTKPHTLSIEDVPYYAKPALRPLSDLAKEIEINGEKFVPYDKLNYKPTIKHVSDYPFNYNDLQFISHYSFQLLLEWHFDVYGLIPLGLAIDINTI